MTEDIRSFEQLPFGLPDTSLPIALVIIGQSQPQIAVDPEVETIMPPPEPVAAMRQVPIDASTLQPIAGLPACDVGLRITGNVTIDGEGDALQFRDVGLTDGNVRMIGNLRWPACVGGGLSLTLSGAALEFVIQGYNHVTED